MKTVLHLLLGVHTLRAAARLLPGLGLAVVLMLAAAWLADGLGAALLRAQGVDPTDQPSPVSPVPIAIIIGLLLRNTLPLPALAEDGLRFATTKVLRLGIILLGLKLSLIELARVGAGVLPAVALVIAAGLAFTLLAARTFALPPRLGALIAAGTSVCGVSAILCTAPAIKAEQREVAYAVACITLFGLAAMLLYPFLAPLLLHSSSALGMFFGTAVHDTSQVVGAALTYSQRIGDDSVLKIATVTKLARNLFLMVVIPLLAYFALRGEAAGQRLPLGRLLPAFVLGFVLMAVLRSVGDAALRGGPGSRALGLWTSAEWKSLTRQLADLWGARYCLGVAMAAVGLQTSIGVFRDVGVRPLVVALAAALFVAVCGGGAAWIFAPFVSA